MEIPRGTSPEDNKVRRQIIKVFYSEWVANHPEKMIWNSNMQANIHVKNQSLNEVLEHAPRSYESTFAFTQLTEILQNATFVKNLPTRRNDNNQKMFSRMILLR